MGQWCSMKILEKKDIGQKNDGRTTIKKEGRLVTLHLRTVSYHSTPYLEKELGTTRFRFASNFDN